MATGTPKTETEIAAILFDAAREGVKAAAEKHGCGESSIYAYQHRYPDFWERVEQRLRPVIRMDAYELGSRAKTELMKRLDEKPDSINPGQLIGAIREAYSIFERFARMDAAVKPRDVVLKGLKEKDPEIIGYVKEILWAIPEGELDGILNGDKSGNTEEISGEGPT